MARIIYRFYLYAVSIALLIFIATATGSLLNVLLQLLPLAGPSANRPAQATVVQSLVFFIVACIVGGGLGALHYWLIRRDIQHDHSAAYSAIRSFFLNMTEAIAVLVVVPTIGFTVLLVAALSSGSDYVWSLSVALPGLAVYGLLEWERRRVALPATGLARTFQRVHWYGVQALLLLYLMSGWFNITGPLYAIIFQHVIKNDEYTQIHVVFLLAALLWFVAWWLGYSWTTRKDGTSVLRTIFFAYGIGFLLYGLYILFNIVVLFLFNKPVALEQVFGAGAGSDFATPLLLGLLVAAVFHLWYGTLLRQNGQPLLIRTLNERAVVAVLAAGAFWLGCGLLFDSVLHHWLDASSSIDVQRWGSIIALLLMGLLYAPLSVVLQRNRVQHPAKANGPWRGLLLVQLGGGVVTLAVGAATTLYVLIVAALGSPVADSQQIISAGIATLLVGVLLVGLFWWLSRGLHVFSRPDQAEHPVETPAPVPANVAAEPLPAQGTTTIDAILDILIAGKMTREEAGIALHALIDHPQPPKG